MTPEISSQIHSPNIRRPVPVGCDILTGGAPAGPMAAYHPCFRVAESRLPAKRTLLANLAPLERLGVAEKVRSARVDHVRAEPMIGG
jgi:hypothetical protein